jgi:hypothetical protein
LHKLPAEFPLWQDSCHPLISTRLAARKVSWPVIPKNAKKPY